MTTLFDPLQLGDLTLPNRIIMAPLTRCRARDAQGEHDARIPNDIMAQYYAQRASAGLILSEAVAVSPQGVGYPDTPGIWSEAQIEGWKRITDAVHTKGGRIFMQLWHVGRISHPSYLNGELPVAPSAIAPEGYVSLVRPKTEYLTPRALDISEIPAIVETYRQGAFNAKAAGFDGVEIHGANGYLLDQFLQDSTNLRTDAYGGTIENRARLMIEAVDAAISVFGAGRVGLHLAPRGDSHDMGDANPLATFGYVVQQMAQRKIAFIFTREHLGPDRISPELKKIFGGVLIANEGFTLETAQHQLATGQADAVAFGRDFIASPDLPKRFETGAALNQLNMQTCYGVGQEDLRVGYVDYPVLGSS